MLANVRAIKKPAERALSIMICIADKSPVNRLLSIVMPRGRYCSAKVGARPASNKADRSSGRL
jgi:hypothetical protein